ncbi:hypothetical protein BpHYR1_040679 [Brachionus plicatilis]|uniref:Uncharacterized protein n=1 Tax=Brachionus plicatilis TaxID=10195 RepID=A0A3M7STL6_BRAPC|nr:hypothetical protein BpHYR1_040679 [Brachionus plicatilis]
MAIFQIFQIYYDIDFLVVSFKYSADKDIDLEDYVWKELVAKEFCSNYYSFIGNNQNFMMCRDEMIIEIYRLRSKKFFEINFNGIFSIKLNSVEHIVPKVSSSLAQTTLQLKIEIIVLSFQLYEILKTKLNHDENNKLLQASFNDNHIS